MNIVETNLKGNKMITYEYNAYVMGYVVKYHDGWTCNFQFSKIDSNHPEPDFELKPGCEAHRKFTDEELAEMSEFMRDQSDVKELVGDYTKAIYAGMGYRYPLFVREISEYANKVK